MSIIVPILVIVVFELIFGRYLTRVANKREAVRTEAEKHMNELLENWK